MVCVFVHSPLYSRSISISSQRQTVFASDTICFSGNAVVTHPLFKLRSPSIFYDARKELVSCKGDAEQSVTGEYQGMSIVADSCFLKKEGLFGHLKNARVTTKYGIVSVEDFRHEEGRSYLHGIRYTGCDHEQPHWHLSARSGYIENKRLYVQGLSFSLGTLPCLYVPFAQLPFGKKNVSGLLCPSIAFDKERGLYLSQKIFFAPRDGFDATTGIKFAHKRGCVFSQEVRAGTHDNRWLKGEVFVGTDTESQRDRLVDVWCKGAGLYEQKQGAARMHIDVDAGSYPALTSDFFSEKRAYNYATDSNASLRFLGKRMTLETFCRHQAIKRADSLGATEQMTVWNIGAIDARYRCDIGKQGVVYEHASQASGLRVDDRFVMQGRSEHTLSGGYFGRYGALYADVGATAYAYGVSGVSLLKGSPLLDARWSSPTYYVGNSLHSIKASYAYEGQVDGYAQQAYVEGYERPYEKNRFSCGYDLSGCYKEVDYAASFSCVVPCGARDTRDPFAMLGGGGVFLESQASIEGGGFSCSWNGAYDFDAHEVACVNAELDWQGAWGGMHTQLSYVSSQTAQKRAMFFAGGAFVTQELRCYPSPRLSFLYTVSSFIASDIGRLQLLKHDVSLSYKGHCWKVSLGYKEDFYTRHERDACRRSFYAMVTFCPLGTLSTHVRQVS